MFKSYWKNVTLGFVSLLAGYTLIHPVAQAEQVSPPEEGKAQIVFMRPSFFGAAIKGSIFDITSGENNVIGILKAKKKLTYNVRPGEYMFMVIGENADFMKAKFEAGKTYYVLVQVRAGGWKARFSLVPIRKAELNGDKFRKWNKKTKVIENRDKAVAWAAKNAKSIEDKRSKYMEKWNAKPDPDKAARTLWKEDGI